MFSLVCIAQYVYEVYRVSIGYIFKDPTFVFYIKEYFI